MRYENVNCTACGKTFTAEDDVVVCPVCGAPHHRTCWAASGACAKAEAHKDGYVWIFPEEVLQQKKAAEAAENARSEEGGVKLKNGENVVPCPGCGAMCCENDIYCLRCGARLDGSGPVPSDEYDDDTENIDYKELRDDFNRFGGINPDAPMDGIPCWEYAEYVGGDKPGRIIRKVSTMERFGRKTSWSWAALLLGPIWFFWRKMKKEGAILAIVMIFLAAVMAVLSLDDAMVDYIQKSMSLSRQLVSGQIDLESFRQQNAENYDAYADAELENPNRVRDVISAVLEYCLFGAVPVGCALLGIGRYRKNAKEDILRIRGECGSMDEYVSALRAEGGTSVGLAVVGVLLTLAVAGCLMYLPWIIVAVFM